MQDLARFADRELVGHQAHECLADAELALRRLSRLRARTCFAASVPNVTTSYECFTDNR
jgi:hypothetical protein